MTDKDNDGMDDGWESTYGLDNTTSDSYLDPDNDELTNIGEFKNGTHPYNNDTDGDGMHDGWEVYYNFNPLNASDANDDPDKDGYTNIQEYQNGTDPLWKPEEKTNKDENEIQGASLAIIIYSFILIITIVIIIFIIKLKK